MDNYTIRNANAISEWAEDGWAWGIPVNKDECEKARKGEWRVLLTPDTSVPHEWFPPLAGTKLLGLASGGGQQIPIFSILGTDCTVMDLSDKQPDSERMVAKREGYRIQIIHHMMVKPLDLICKALKDAGISTYWATRAVKYK